MCNGAEQKRVPFLTSPVRPVSADELEGRPPDLESRDEETSFSLAHILR